MAKKKKIAKVLFVASEMTPLAKVGGLGDVIGSLPEALVKMGVDARVIIPRYEIINIKKLDAKKIFKYTVKAGNKNEPVIVYEAKLSESGIKTYFLENERYLSRGPVYFQRTAFAGSLKEIKRFLFFSKAVFELTQTPNFSFKPDIVHAHDWHTGALTALSKKFNVSYKTIFTIHNLGNQGEWGADDIDKWIFGGKANIFKEGGSDKKYNFLAEGIMNADAVSTVSPTYAKEILTPEYGSGLDKILRRKDRIRGILNGIDYKFWNPKTDSAIFKKYSVSSLAGKQVNKSSFQKLYGLSPSPNAPLFGLVSRLTDQKGIDLAALAAEELIECSGAQFAFLGEGSAKYEKMLTRLAQKYPRNVFALIGFDAELANRIYAASDFFLMPSVYEPCGLGQMIAMRYGTIPVVRKTGGLADTVLHGKTGFVFEGKNFDALISAIKMGIALFENKNRFTAMQKACMKKDFSWRASAKEYKIFYDKIISA